ncbi:MAG TPA: M1 family aminopeptidase, partial [Kaistella chaponensis]|uniref:M1 family aminopeptidase n=1 Tax=Kaistella chaponensis TaxID=713588 RepID=UPI002C2290A2
TLSNGIMKSSTKVSGGLRTDHWVMDKKHAPYLFFMGVGEYAIVKDKWRNIEVDYYVEKEYEPFAKQIFGNTPEMIEFFSKRLNYDYPWSKYAQITGRDFVSGAMENTTATLHQESAQQKPGDLIDENRWEDTIAHELFHHWFGDLVTAESWSNLTVNESFANYSQYLWNEHKYGKDIADYGLMKEIRGYMMDPSNISKDLVRFNYHSREDMFDGVSYNKGGAILHMLRNYVGDDAFFAGLTDYLKTNEFGTGEAHQLRLSLEKISGKDLNWFFNQWYFGNGNPKISYTTSFEPVKKEVTITLSQNQIGQNFQFPLAIDIFENGKPTRKNVWVSAKEKNDFTFQVSKNPDLVNLNSDGVLLAEITDTKTPEQFLIQYQNSTQFLSRYKAVENAIENLTKNPAALKTVVAALKDSNFRIRGKALVGLDLSKPDQAKAALAEVEKMASSDPKTLVQGAAISALGKIKDKKYLPLFEKGMNAVSNSVKANSLAGIAAVDPSRIASLADKIDLEGADEEVIAELMPIIVKNKIEKQMAAIASTAAFYPFIKFQKPELGDAAEAGFNWIMSSDNLKATENVTKVLTQVKGQIGQNPQAKMMIVQILKDGLEKKMVVLKANPSSSTIHQQIDLINKTIEVYK